MLTLQDSLADTVTAAANGDEQAWNALVARFDPLLRRVARGYRLAPEDVDEVVQATWVATFESLGQLREPWAIGAWLITVTRRRAFRIRQRHVREVPTEFPIADHLVSSDCCETAVIDLERAAALRQAVRRLQGRQRVVVESMIDAPERNYRDLAQGLGIPIGSIGPTRERGLSRLRRDEQLARAVAS
jgi:RNA polymerase sigma factor (sigma-70 family)